MKPVFVKVVFPALLSLGAAMGAGALRAQTPGELTDSGPPGPGERAPERATAARSPLWMAVEAHRQQREAAPPDRRLSAEQRQQLREQVRRASLRMDGVQPVVQSADSR